MMKMGQQHRRGYLGRILRIAGATTALMAAVAAWLIFSAPETPSDGPRYSGEALIGGPLSLVDHSGTAVTDTDFRGRLMLVYFGYSSCPDICPLELEKMSRALDLLGPAAKRVQPLFITIDPARDTVEVLADYMSHFHPGFLGLTGTAEQIRQAAKAYRIYYARATGETGHHDDHDGYLMDHGSIVYLMDGKGHYLTHFSADATPEAMAEAVIEHDRQAQR
ncbi:MAG: SCO family protein [Sphingomonadales bacterium]